MEIVLNPTATRVWRTPTSLQIGLGETKVVFDNLPARQEQFIVALASGLTAQQARDYGRQLKLRAVETQAIINQLRPLLLANSERVRFAAESGETLETEITAREIAEVASLDVGAEEYQNARGEMNQASYRLSARGESVWLRRKSSAAFVGQLDRTGSRVAEGLAEAGVGAIVSGDITPSRVEALKRFVAESGLATRVFTLNELKETQITKIGVAILVGQQLIEPQKFAAWMNRHTPTIAVVLASAAENLNPLISHPIIAGQTPCWVCFEHWRLQNDPAWPAIAGQLIGREQPFDSASASLRLAGRAVEAALDQIDAANRFTSPKTVLRWQFHDSCLCRFGS